MEKPVALVVDDEPQMAMIVAYALETQGFEVVQVYDGEQALELVREKGPDLVVLDVMLPKMNGFEVCRHIREETSIPVILLTARSDDDDVIQGLELGADDYITKPFNPREVALRAQAVLRRSGWGDSSSTIQIRNLVIDVDRYQARINGELLNLTHNEFRLLVCLAKNSGRALSWQSLLKHAWDVESWEGGKQMVKTAVYRLRQKIEVNPEEPTYIVTVRSVGYIMPASERYEL